MRYLLLILLLAGGYYGWDYYQTGLVPRHEAIKAMEQEPYPELDAACDDAIVEFIDTTKEEQIPVDGFQLSSGYCTVETDKGIKRLSLIHI